MATVFESPFLSNRLRQIEERYEGNGTFGRCDCTSYSYLALSIMLFAVGSTITIFALGDVANGHIFSNLGHMWLIGPIFMASGLMVGAKCMLYLRRKSVLQMILHQRQFFRELSRTHDIIITTHNSGSITSNPPAYDIIAQDQNVNEVPPPSYAEAVALLQKTCSNGTKAESGTVSSESTTSQENTQNKP